ncbi:MAG: hypothetical protein ACYTFQ_03285 [Planctomycetota bacterium]|jgi:hypothetical protein
MSEIHKPSIERIKTPVDGEGKLALFEALVDEAEEFGNEVGQVCMPFVEKDDEFVEGTWVPELWLVVRKVLPNEEK